jgi:hypothetical protein
MSEPEGFLSRWARLKREAEETPETAPQDAPDNESHEGASQGAPCAASDADAEAPLRETATEKPAIDLSALPSIESITATTDIRAFLAPGVPAELTRAALRRAWVVDPKIRDFVGIADYQWDFTDPNAMPGFGPLSPLDDVRRLVARIMGEAEDGREALTAPAEARHSAEVADGSDLIAPCSSEAGITAAREISTEDEEPAATLHPAGDVRCSSTDSASQQEEPPSQTVSVPIKRGHGGALPK